MPLYSFSPAVWLDRAVSLAVLSIVFAAPEQAGYLLANVLEAHPGMKLVAAREVERFLFRPGLAERARYYAVVFLNQVPLSHAPAHGAALTARFAPVRRRLAGGLFQGCSSSDPGAWDCWLCRVLLSKS